MEIVQWREFHFPNQLQNVVNPILLTIQYFRDLETHQNLRNIH